MPQSNGKKPRAALSRDEVLKLADREAKHLAGTSYAEAVRKLDKGDLEGTAAEAELKMFRFLLAD